MLVFNIKNIRFKKGMSIYKLSQLSGISRTNIRDLENNKTFNPTIKTLEKISSALNVNIKDLFYSTLDIEELRKEMHNRINKYGLNSKETLEISKIIDMLINIDFKELD